MHRIRSDEVLRTSETIDGIMPAGNDGDIEGWSEQPGAEETTAEGSSCLVEDGLNVVDSVSEALVSEEMSCEKCHTEERQALFRFVRMDGRMAFVDKNLQGATVGISVFRPTRRANVTSCASSTTYHSASELIYMTASLK